MNEARPTDLSLGDLVARATGDVSNLVKAEIALAKLELKQDAKRAFLSGGLFLIAAVAGCLIVIMASFALAYGFVAWGAWGGQWAAFLYVAGVYAILAMVLIVLGLLRLRRMNKIQRTRSTVKADIAMLRRATADGDDGASAVAGRDDQAALAE